MSLGIGADPGSITSNVTTALDFTYNSVRYEVRCHKGDVEWWVRINGGSGVNRKLKVKLSLWSAGASATGGNHTCVHTSSSPLLSSVSGTYGDIAANAGWSKVLLIHRAFTDGWRCHSVNLKASSDNGATWVNVGTSLCPCV